MKKVMYLFATMLLVFQTASTTFGQDASATVADPNNLKARRIPPANIQEYDAKRPNGELKNAFSMTIPNTKSNDLMRKWDKKARSFDAKSKRVSEELFTDNAKIPGFTNDVDLYVRTTQEGENANILVFAENNGVFLTSKANFDQANIIKAILKSIDTETAKEKIEEELKSEDRKLKQAQRDLDKLQKELKNNKEDVERKKREISDLEKAQIVNTTDQETKTKEIEIQKVKYSEVEKEMGKYVD